MDTAAKSVAGMDTKTVRAELKARGVPQADIDRCMNYVEYRTNVLNDGSSVEYLAGKWLSEQ